MRKRISIELFEEGEKANIYSYRINDGDLEFEKFIDTFIDSTHSEDYDIIDDVIDKILLNGAQERYFRPEGKFLDYLFAIPQKGLGCQLRVFCLRINEQIIILGNGGIKPKGMKKYQDDIVLNGIAEEMQAISEKLRKSIGDFSTTIYHKEFIQIKKNHIIVVFMNPDIRKKYLARKAKKAEKTSTYVDLSDNIAISIMEALKIANINKTEFAKRLGKETSVVSRWLNGQHNFTIKTIVDIENALKQKIVFPLNKIQSTENLNQHLIILNYDGTYKNDFSKIKNNENPSGKKFTLTNAYGNMLVFNT